MYAFNITDELDAMRRHHDAVRRRGRDVRDGEPEQRRPGRRGRSSRRHCQLPIHGHRNGWGMLSRHPLSRASSSPRTRSSGGSPASTTSTSTACATSSASRTTRWSRSVAGVPDAAVRRRRGHAGDLVGPVGGPGARDVPTRSADVDLMYLCGGGIMAHPGGPEAGAIRTGRGGDKKKNASSVALAVALAGAFGFVAFERWRRAQRRVLAATPPDDETVLRVAEGRPTRLYVDQSLPTGSVGARESHGHDPPADGVAIGELGDPVGEAARVGGASEHAVVDEADEAGVVERAVARRELLRRGERGRHLRVAVPLAALVEPVAEAGGVGAATGSRRRRGGRPARPARRTPST